MKKVKFIDFPTGIWDNGEQKINEFISLNNHELIDIKVQSVETKGYRTIVAIIYREESK